VWVVVELREVELMIKTRSDDFVDDLVLERIGRLRRNKVSGGAEAFKRTESVARSVVRLPNHHLAKPDQNGKYKAQIPAGHGCQFDGVFLVMRETAKSSPCARASRQHRQH
jgi:hypothetical protein